MRRQEPDWILLWSGVELDELALRKIIFQSGEQRDSWKGNKYCICWRSHLESCLPYYYCCTIILWRVSPLFCFVCVLVFFHLGVWKCGRSQMFISMWHQRANLYHFSSCSKRNCKTGGKKDFLLFFLSSLWVYLRILGRGFSPRDCQSAMLPEKHHHRVPRRKDQKLFAVSYLSVRTDQNLPSDPKESNTLTHLELNNDDDGFLRLFFSLVFPSYAI